jgi:hypothetical protein
MLFDELRLDAEIVPARRGAQDALRHAPVALTAGRRPSRARSTFRWAVQAIHLDARHRWASTRRAMT